MVRPPGSAVILVVAATLLSGCDTFLSRHDKQKVLEWLTCDECTDGELAFLTDTLGTPARGPLRQVLLAFPQDYRDQAVITLRAAWRSYEGTGVDSISFRNRFLSNYEAKLQRRAVLGLAALGDTASLREARDSSLGGFIGYRADVAELIDRSLQAAGAPGFVPPTVAQVEVVPDAVTLPVGEAGSLAARVTDAAGNPVPAPLTWTSSNPNVAAVTSPAWGHGVVTAGSPGDATVTAASGSVYDTALVHVDPAGPPPPTLVILSGDAQRDTVSTQLDLPLRVRLTNAANQPISGATVAWRFVHNGPQSQYSSPTDANGEATYQPTLGPNPGRVWIRATAQGQAVRFQLIAFQP